jgi:hypothetical protein
MDTGNNYNKYLKIPHKDPGQLMWPLCFTGIRHAVDEGTKKAQQYNTH